MTLTRRAVLSLLAAGAAGFAAVPAHAASTDFQTWLKALRKEAQGKGISARTLDLALADVAPIPKVLELDRHQPEFTLTFDAYVAKVVNAARIQTGRERLAEHRGLLDRIAQQYGVPQRFIVALWAIESDFGRITGNFLIVPALATLAYDGRRSSFFRGELLLALKIVDQGHISAREMRGSWAGAMGQNQFMPSSFLSYAVDYDGDGRRDIWGSLPDVFASIANYLARVGWRRGESWGQPVSLPPILDRSLIDHRSVRKPIADWTALGVRPLADRPVAPREEPVGIVQPGGAAGPTYLVGANYRALLRWNNSTYFATAVGYIADGLGDR